jgi:regulator of protease activity HflC (stomatin/prohibitin superfamily)
MFNLIKSLSPFIVVNQAETAYRQFLGMNRIKLDPGFRLRVPILHQVDRVDMRERSIYFTELNGFTSDNVPVSVSGTLFYKVTDAEKACFSVSNYVNAVASVGESTSRAIIGRFAYDKIISQRNELNAELVKLIDTSIDEWGISCNRFEITEFKPQNDGVRKHLEKQMEAERSRRENELNTQAKIRTAEGERDALKLKSDAEFYQVKLEADSKAYSVEKNAAALAKQVEILKKAFPNLNDAQLSDFLLETERQKNLNAIAHNNKNAVYFVDPKNMYPMQRHITMDKQQ